MTRSAMLHSAFGTDRSGQKTIAGFRGRGLGRRRRAKPLYQAIAVIAALILQLGPLATHVDAAFAGSATEETIIFILETPAGLEIQGAEGGYDDVKIPGYASVSPPGNPLVPQKLYQVALPPDTDWASVELRVVGTEVEEIPGSFNLAPAPPAAAWDESDRIVDWAGAAGQILTDANGAVYGVNDLYPGQYAGLVGLSQAHSLHYVKVMHTPVQWSPASGRLLVATTVEVELAFHRRPMLLEEVARFETRNDESLMSSFLNEDQARQWYGSDPEDSGGAFPQQQQYDYVIITTNAIESGSTKLTDFIAHKQALGLSPMVITEDEYGSLTGQAPNGTADRIRRWLIDNYAIYGIEYVLLVGNPHPDTGDIPMKKCWPRWDQSSYRDSPTDYYYADLTGNWDLDGDTNYGEYVGDSGAGGVDFANEVYVGRIPVYGASYTTLDAILQKIMDYENEAGDVTWRRSALLPMSFSDASTDGAYLAEYMKTDYLTSSGFDAYTLYQHKGTGCNSAFASNQDLVGGATGSHWSASDYGLVAWWGHGSSRGAYIGYGDCSDGLILDSSGTLGLDDDHPAFIYQCSCTNGQPEDSNNLGYALLKSGSIGTVVASRVSWYAVTSWYPGLKYYADNASLGYHYSDRLVADEPAGQALYHVKADMGQNLYSYWGGSSWMNLMDFNLYGDPSTGLTRDFTTWTGDYSSQWNDSRNWEPGEVPGAQDKALIPGDATRWPSLDGDASILSVTITDGGQLSAAAGATLNVYGSWTVRGTGQFAGDSTTVVFRGSGPQLISSEGELAFHNLQIGDGQVANNVTISGDVTVAGDLTLQPGATLAAGASTIRLGGDWTDDGATFLPGTSAVILDGAAQTIRRRSDPLLGPEGFEGAFPPLGWTAYDSTGNGRVWQRNDALGTSNLTNGTGYSAASKAYDSLNTVPWDNELRSPQVSIPAWGATLSYQSNFQDYAGNGDAWLDVSTDGGSTWGNVTHWTLDHGPTLEEVDLGPYAGRTIMLRWRYTAAASAAWYWQIDDVTVSAPGGWDGGLELYDLTVAGNATLSGNLSIGNDLVIQNGAILDVAARAITSVEGTVSNEGSLQQTRDVADGTTTSFLAVDGGKYYGVDLHPTSGAMGSTTVTVMGGQACPYTPASVLRCYEISPGTPQTADVTLYYRDVEENGQYAASMWHWNGIGWDPVSSARDRSGTEDNWVRAEGVSEFSPFALSNDFPTAVDLLLFEATARAEGVIQVQWETVTDADTLGFNLSRSDAPDGQYQRLNDALILCRAPGSPLGGLYTWQDTEIQQGKTYYYMLEVVETAGATSLHGPVSASTTGSRYVVFLPKVTLP